MKQGVPTLHSNFVVPLFIFSWSLLSTGAWNMNLLGEQQLLLGLVTCQRVTFMPSLLWGQVLPSP